MARRRVRAIDPSVQEQLLHEAATLQNKWRPHVEPFFAGFTRSEQQEHALHYVTGLLSSLTYKTTETIATLFNQPRHGLQHFLGASSWDSSPLLTELARQVDDALGQPDGIVVVTLWGFQKKGKASVGVGRQSLTPTGPVQNCQLAVYLGYASNKGTGVVDVRLYLPSSWTRDWQRRRQCGVPARRGHLTPAHLTLELLGRLGNRLPHNWIVADASLGHSASFRQAMGRVGKHYLVAIPATVLVRPFGEAASRSAFVPAEELGASLSASAWSPSQAGHRMPEVAVVPAITQVTQRAQQRETLIVVRSSGEAAATTYYLSNVTAELPAEEWTRAAEAVTRVEAYLQRARKEAGLASYEVRTWEGWHHHQALALVAAWLLEREGGTH